MPKLMQRLHYERVIAAHHVLTLLTRAPALRGRYLQGGQPNLTSVAELKQSMAALESIKCLLDSAGSAGATDGRGESERMLEEYTAGRIHVASSGQSGVLGLQVCAKLDKKLSAPSWHG